jgi:hypothetical protein
MTELNTTFIINGGAGRVINSIPALEKYHKLNPNDDFVVLVQGWESLFWSHPILQSRTFSANQKGNFDRYIKNSRVVCPEPYHNTDFFNQRINLVQAFDQEINQTKEHSNLNYKCLHLSEYEIIKSSDYIENLKSQKKKRKVVVFQPFGSGAEIVNKQVIDKSNRSFQLKDYYKIVQSLSKDCVIIYASDPIFRQANDSISVTFDDMQPYHRMLMCMIYHCDYFVGCCSVGQHVARAFVKPGLVCMGGTDERNFSYPDHFTIYRKNDTPPVYVPWRVSEVDCEFADRANDGLMKFDDKELNNIIKIIKKNIGSSTIEKTGDVEVSYD